jgi:predicted nucleic acid-binding protein
LKRVADTSAWIELLTRSALTKQIYGELPNLEHLIVPTLVQHELAKWLLRERGEETADKVITLTLKCAVIPLDTETALAAAEICRAHKLATADAIIYATALRHEAELITCDAHFEGLPGVIYLAKPKPPVS